MQPTFSEATHEPVPIAAPTRVGALEATPPPFVASARHDAADHRRRSPAAAWFVPGTVAAIAIGAVALGWPVLSRMWTTTSNSSDDRTFVGPRPQAAKGGGALSVTSTPAGAQVTVDGKLRGVTPLTLKDLPAGKHDVLLKSEAGSVRRTVTVAANQTESMDEQIFSGWMTLYSPFEVTMAEGQRVLRPDDRNQVMLPPGIHALRVMNKTLGYEAVLQVDVKPGEGTNVRLTPPPSTLTVTAPDAAEVTVDGVRAGETPLNGLSIPLGTHDIVVRRPNGGEKRYTITIGVKPYTLNVDF